MVASIGQMASAEYYLESQRSYRHPNEYYTAGEEPDGTWFNPKGLFDLEDEVKVDSGQFQRLYNGFAPDESGKLVQRAGNPDRSPGVDMTFSVDKSVSALWAIAEPETRERIEAMAVAAARAALEDSVLKYCSYTRVSENGVTRPVDADLMGATFVHGTSRENDPQLHVHCTIFNLARTREDGKWRAHHQYPVYSWKKAAGALFRAYMAWELQQGLGVRMERYGPNAEFTRIEGMPDDLKAFWSKRRKAIVAMAGELGIPSLGNASRIAAETAASAAGPAPERLAPSRPAEDVAPGPARDAPPDWRTLYKELQQDWNDLVARSEEPDLPLLLIGGYETLIRRVRTLADHPGLSEHARNVLDNLLEYHDEETVARETAEGYLAAAEHHVEAYKVLERQAQERGLPVARLDAWPDWREAAEMLAATGKSVLSNEERYGAYFEVMTIGKARARLTVEQLRSRLRQNRTHAPKPEVRQPRREPTPKQEQGFAHILDDREKLRQLREKAEQQDRKRGRHLRRSRGLSI